MAAAKLLIDRVISSRRGGPGSFDIRPLKSSRTVPRPTPTFSTMSAPAG